MSAFLCFTGCDTTSETADSLLTALQKEELVDADLTLVDKMSKIGTVLFYTKTTYYIYENKNGEFIAINYDKSISSENDYDYSVEIYSDVSIDNDIEYLDDDATPDYYYSYQDGKKSEDNKYVLENRTEYFVYESKPLFFKTRYRIENVGD